MSTRKELIAKAIFNWFNENPNDDRSAPPFTFNDDAKNLTIGVDGYLDCKELAAAIDIALEQEPKS